MRKLLTLLLLIAAGIASAQTTYSLRYDTVKVEKTTGAGNAELIVKNAQRAVAGIAYNRGNGWLGFKTLTASDIPVLDWSKITTGTPTTLAGYGITDGALNSAVVHLAGYETITGYKTFSERALFDSYPIFTNQLAFKGSVVSYNSDYHTLSMDTSGNLHLAKINNPNGANIAFNNTLTRDYTLPDQSGTIALDANVVHLAGNETITGPMTFNNTVLVGGNITVGSGSTLTTNGIDNYQSLLMHAGTGTTTINAGLSSGSNTVTLPSGTGTVALTSDITANNTTYPVNAGGETLQSVTDRGATTTKTITITRQAGVPSISGGTSDVAIDGTTTYLNPYSSGHVILSGGGGKVAIGTSSPAYKFHTYSAGNTGVASGAMFGEFYGTAIGTTTVSSSYYALNVLSGVTNGAVNSAGGTSLLFVRADGNIGIGTSAPAEKLHVVGNVRNSVLAGTGNRAVYSDANGNLTNSASDSTLKTNIAPVAYGIDAVKNLHPVLYNWKDTTSLGSQREIGFLAQEVRNVVPEVIGTNSTGKLSLDYPKLTAVLTKALQELIDKVNAQQAQIDALNAKVNP